MTRLTAGTSTLVLRTTTGQREFFSDLDSGVKGSIKFGDASTIEINGVGSIIFKAKTGGTASSPACTVLGHGIPYVDHVDAALRHLCGDQVEASTLPASSLLPRHQAARAGASRPLRSNVTDHSWRSTLLPTARRRCQPLHVGRAA